MMFSELSQQSIHGFNDRLGHNDPELLPPEVFVDIRVDAITVLTVHLFLFQLEMSPD